VQQALANGTQIAEFEIVGLIGEGGFGIVYLAYDTQLRRNVALKEYIPAALASRVGTAEVTVKSERHEETFRAGLKSFINEARLLAQFDHHSLVKVYRFWEANGTAYMVMPYYDGVTLRDALRQMPQPPDEAWLYGLLKPLIEALAVLHAAQCYHRDIAPDNILLLKGSGRPLLLDFGAARRVIGDMTQALTVILKPGFAPVEQYADEPSMKQGPWTDVYALAAVIYFAIQGKTPPPAVGRLMSDSCAPLATAAASRYSERFLRAIDHALSVRPEDRPQSVQAFAAGLGIEIDEPGGAPDAGSAGSTRSLPVSGATGTGGTGAASRAIPANAPASAPASPPASDSRTRAEGAAPGATALAGAAPAGKSRRPALIAAAAVCVAALVAVGGWVVWSPASKPLPAPTVSKDGEAVSPPATSPAPEKTARNEATPAPAQAAMPTPTQPAPVASTKQPQAVAPASAAGTPAQPVASSPAPYTPAGELDRIAALADPSVHVTTALRSTTARINKDHLQFKVSSNRAGYVYVFMVDPAGQYLMLFPNGLDRNNAIAAGQTLSLPRPNWPMMAGAPAGPNRFLVMVSTVPRNFDDGGLRDSSVFAGFPADAQRDAAQRRTASYSPFAGRPRCAAGATDCPDTFGAATFMIEVVNSST
jgi:serine/threonine protein kinase